MSSLAADPLQAQPDRHDHQLHSFQRQQLTDVYYSEGATAGDLNGDGIHDVVYGPYWFEGPGFEVKHEIYPAVPQNRDGYADNFFSWVYDFDGNGDNDILTVGFPGRPGFVYRNPGKAALDQLWERIEILDSVSNESPQFADITGDGRPELVCTRNGHYGFATFDPAAPFQHWTFTNISDDIAPKPFGHGLGVGDINGDGRLDVIARDGWMQHPAAVNELLPWKFHKVNFAPAGADMFAYDVDGDGDNDVITSLNAHSYGLAWHENTPGENGEIRFVQHLIMGDKKSDSPYGVLFTEPHAVKLADINGDGLPDIITGKTYWSHHTQSPMWDAGAVTYWFELHREQSADGSAAGVEFIPHLADDDAGIGRGLFVGDITGDGLPDIVTGGMKGCHVLTHAARSVSHEEFELAQPSKRPAMAEGLAPEAAAAQMTVPAGFRVQLAAGEPLVHQPLAMCFDTKGRLWVAEGHTYPLRAAAGEGRDRIVIFEDTNGDGIFDTSKTFIEGLNLVSGLEVGFGGVYVGAAPYLLFIADADGDDVPDVIRKSGQVPDVQFPADVPPSATVLLDGFGWHDTHETLNGFIWGPDGWLYGCHGVFTHSKVGKPGTPDDQRQGLNCGVWRYHPVRHEFEVFAHGTSNPWGVDFNDRGHAFITACVIPHLWHMIQGARYHRQGGQHFNPFTYDDIKTIADHAHYVGNIRDHAWWGHEPKASGGTDDAGGGHAHAGAMIYLGDNWPDSFRNRIYFNNIHGNRVNCDILEKQPARSEYVGHHGDDFLFANDHYYRGINLRYGPDGSVYLIDWYDKNACHRTNPEIWDRTNGRIYRVSYGAAKATPAMSLPMTAAADLLAAHEQKNEWFVRMAQNTDAPADRQSCRHQTSAAR
ncbi:MAG: FG-GAP-like repeat-containing protein [Planctomycetaceae bacterium]